MIGVKYIGPVNDFSGYGEAARNYIFSLNKRGVPVTVFPRNFDPNPPPIADEEQRETLNFLIDRNISYDVVIIHLTPDLYPHYAEPNKYNIGFAAWETSALHPKWAHTCSAVNEMWVPCEWNVEALRNSNVGVPVFKIPHGVDPHMFDHLEGKEFSVPGVSPSTFKFYSIFQWMYRKNPDGLLRAYFNAFSEQDDVALILKTYRMGMNKDKEFIRDQIINIKKDMNIGGYPKVILIGDLLSKTQMLGLHLYGDACACLHRGEGWGLPLFEAGMAGNAVIATNCGGNMEFMDDDNSFLVDSQMTYVSNMSTFNPWYLGNQQWAEPNIVHASEVLRYVYENKDEAAKRGETIKASIVDRYSWEKVAGIVVNRLSNI